MILRAAIAVATAILSFSTTVIYGSSNASHDNLRRKKRERHDQSRELIPKIDETKNLQFNSDECLKEWTALKSAIILSTVLNPGSAHDFTLCPGKVFLLDSMDSDGDLKPIDIKTTNSVFRCGDDGNPENNCLIVGGYAHFKMVGTVKDVTFLGITFSGARLSSILAAGEADAAVQFVNCAWIDNYGYSAILVYNEKEGVPITPETMISDLVEPRKRSMKVECEGCIFSRNNLKNSSITNLSGEVYVNRSVFVDDKTLGGVIISKFESTLFIEDSCFLKNVAQLAGIVVVDERGTVEMNKNTFGDKNQIASGSCDEIWYETEDSCIGGSNPKCVGLCGPFTSTAGCSVNLKKVEAIADIIEDLYPTKPKSKTVKEDADIELFGVDPVTILAGGGAGILIIVLCCLGCSYRFGQKSVLAKYAAIPIRDDDLDYPQTENVQAHHTHSNGQQNPVVSTFATPSQPSRPSTGAGIESQEAFVDDVQNRVAELNRNAAKKPLDTKQQKPVSAKNDPTGNRVQENNVKSPVNRKHSLPMFRRRTNETSDSTDVAFFPLGSKKAGRVSKDDGENSDSSGGTDGAFMKRRNRKKRKKKKNGKGCDRKNKESDKDSKKANESDSEQLVESSDFSDEKNSAHRSSSKKQERKKRGKTYHSESDDDDDDDDDDHSTHRSSKKKSSAAAKKERDKKHDSDTDDGDQHASHRSSKNKSRRKKKDRKDDGGDDGDDQRSSKESKSRKKGKEKNNHSDGDGPSSEKKKSCKKEKKSGSDTDDDGSDIPHDQEEKEKKYHSGSDHDRKKRKKKKKKKDKKIHSDTDDDNIAQRSSIKTKASGDKKKHTDIDGESDTNGLEQKNIENCDVEKKADRPPRSQRTHKSHDDDKKESKKKKKRKTEGDSSSSEREDDDGKVSESEIESDTSGSRRGSLSSSSYSTDQSKRSSIGSNISGTSGAINDTEPTKKRARGLSGASPKRHSIGVAPKRNSIDSASVSERRGSMDYLVSKYATEKENETKEEVHGKSSSEENKASKRDSSSEKRRDSLPGKRTKDRSITPVKSKRHSNDGQSRKNSMERSTTSKDDKDNKGQKSKDPSRSKTSSRDKDKEPSSTTKKSSKTKPNHKLGKSLTQLNSAEEETELKNMMSRDKLSRSMSQISEKNSNGRSKHHSKEKVFKDMAKAGRASGVHDRYGPKRGDKHRAKPLNLSKLRPFDLPIREAKADKKADSDNEKSS